MPGLPRRHGIVVCLGGNELRYIESDATLRSLVAKCRSDPSTYCSGVPPLSCDAFGDDFQANLEH